MPLINTDRKRRHGPRPSDDPRSNCVSVRLNQKELEQLDQQRGSLARGEYFRCAALDKLPPVIPAVNHEIWLQLSKSAANLNQIARHLNNGGHIDFEAIKDELRLFRLGLLCIAEEV